MVDSGVHGRNLYSGSNGYNEVYSFLPVEGDIDSFSGDIYGFFEVSHSFVLSIRHFDDASIM